MTTPARWTPETEEAVIVRLARHFHGPGYTAAGHNADAEACAWCWESAVEALQALADAGLLVTPQLAAVVEAARADAKQTRRMLAAIGISPAPDGPLQRRVAIADAVDALEAGRG